MPGADRSWLRTFLVVLALIAVGLLAADRFGHHLALAETIERDIIPGDLNDDGFVNLDDYPLLLDCLHGPDIPEVSPPCARGHFDLDLDIDLHDFAGFQRAFTPTAS